MKNLHKKLGTASYTMPETDFPTSAQPSELFPASDTDPTYDSEGQLEDLPSTQTGSQAATRAKRKKLALFELLAAECLDADQREGRPQKLLQEEKARLLQLV